MRDPVDERIVLAGLVNDYEDFDGVCDAFELVEVPAVFLDELFASLPGGGLDTWHAESFVELGGHR